MLTLKTPTIREEQEVERLLNLSIEELYTEIGQQIGQLDDNQDPEKNAKAILEKYRFKIHDAICIKGNYCQFMENHSSSAAIKIIVTIAQYLAPILDGFPVYSVATVLFETGLNKFCKCD